MLNSLIWFLTDTDFVEEWGSRSTLGKVDLCYTTSGLFLCEAFSLLVVVQELSNLFS